MCVLNIYLLWRSSILKILLAHTQSLKISSLMRLPIHVLSEYLRRLRELCMPATVLVSISRIKHKQWNVSRGPIIYTWSISRVIFIELPSAQLKLIAGYSNFYEKAQKASDLQWPGLFLIYLFREPGRPQIIEDLPLDHFWEFVSGLSKPGSKIQLLQSSIYTSNVFNEQKDFGDDGSNWQQSSQDLMAALVRSAA